mmetsp:Transcript_3612/g.5339  ORF Transcript_3612/g.5339 Transcript_3612/m.5339 type:complete len:296 (+) Transcript_3612:936-1823(+)
MNQPVWKPGHLRNQLKDLMDQCDQTITEVVGLEERHGWQRKVVLPKMYLVHLPIAGTKGSMASSCNLGRDIVSLLLSYPEIHHVSFRSLHLQKHPVPLDPSILLCTSPDPQAQTTVQQVMENFRLEIDRCLKLSSHPSQGASTRLHTLADTRLSPIGMEEKSNSLQFAMLQIRVLSFLISMYRWAVLQDSNWTYHAKNAIPENLTANVPVILAQGTFVKVFRYVLSAVCSGVPPLNFNQSTSVFQDTISTVPGAVVLQHWADTRTLKSESVTDAKEWAIRLRKYMTELLKQMDEP